MKVHIKKKQREPIGWWKVTTPDGREWASDRYKSDKIEQTFIGAVATFGRGVTVEKG